MIVCLLCEKLLVERERERQVDDGRVVDGQATQLADQVVHVAPLEGLIVEPDSVGLLVENEHAVLQVENLAQEQHKKFLKNKIGF